MFVLHGRRAGTSDDSSIELSSVRATQNGCISLVGMFRKDLRLYLERIGHELISQRRFVGTCSCCMDAALAQVMTVPSNCQAFERPKMVASCSSVCYENILVFFWNELDMNSTRNVIL